MGVHYSHYLIPQDNTVRPHPDRIVALIEAWTEQGFIIPANGEPPEAVARFMTAPSAAETVEQEQAAEPRMGLWARLLRKKAPKQPPADRWKPFSAPPSGKSLSALAEPYAVIRWEGNSSAVYPMRTVAELVAQGDDRFPHRLMIELSDDFLNPETDPYGAGGDTKQVSPVCTCGCSLEYESMGWFGEKRVRKVCPSCGRAFRPQDQLAEVVDGTSGEKIAQPGGLCNRFAVIIDFDKEMPLYVRDSEGELVEITPKVTQVFLETCSTALGIKLNEFGYYN